METIDITLSKAEAILAVWEQNKNNHEFPDVAIVIIDALKFYIADMKGKLEMGKDHDIEEADGCPDCGSLDIKDEGERCAECAGAKAEFMYDAQREKATVEGIETTQSKVEAEILNEQK